MAGGVYDVRCLNRAFRADGKQVWRVDRCRAPIVSLYHLVHVEHAEHRIRDELGHRAEGKGGAGATPALPAAGAIRRDSKDQPLGRFTKPPAVLQVSAEPAPLDRFALASSHIYSVRR